MSHWIRRTLLGVFGAGIAVGGLAACGHWRGHEGPHGAAHEARWSERMVDRLARRLDLDAAQKARLEVLATRLREQRASIVGATDPRGQVQALVAGERFDRAAAQALLQDKMAAVQARSPEVIAALADFYDSLRPEQQARVREHLQERRRWWHRG